MILGCTKLQLFCGYNLQCYFRDLLLLLLVVVVVAAVVSVVLVVTVLIIIIIIIIIISSLYTVFTFIRLKKDMILGCTMLQLFCGYNL